MGSVSLAIAYAKPATASSQTNWGVLLGANFATKGSDRIAHHAVGNLLVIDLELTRSVSEAVDVPVIASGGVGNLDHLAAGVQAGGADAVLAASIFHYGEYTVGQAKRHMAKLGIPVRL